MVIFDEISRNAHFVSDAVRVLWLTLGLSAYPMIDIHVGHSSA